MGRMGRPPKPTPATPPPPKRSAKPGIKMHSFELSPEDSAALNAIAAAISARDGSLANRTRALRWAIRELHARLDRGEATIEGMPDA